MANNGNASVFGRSEVVFVGRSVSRLDVLALSFKLGREANEDFGCQKAVVAGFMGWLVDGIFPMRLVCFYPLLDESVMFHVV